MSATLSISVLLAAMSPSVFAAEPSSPTAPAPSVHVSEIKAQRDTRMARWREAKFGLFIHWGLYSVPAGVYHGKLVEKYGEWIMHYTETLLRSLIDIACHGGNYLINVGPDAQGIIPQPEIDPAHKPLTFTQTEKGAGISLPTAAFDPIATVLVLETK